MGFSILNFYNLNKAAIDLFGEKDKLPLFILYFIQHNGPLSINSLHQHISIPLPKLQQAVARLVGNNMVTTKADRLSVTEDGREAIRELGLLEYVAPPEILMPKPAKIKAIGIGGAGCNTITRMVREGIKGVDFIAMNTDARVLALTEVPIRVQLGRKLLRGLGTEGDPVKGQKAAEESRQTIEEVTKGADVVFITAGMGGGTGTGAFPVVAEIAKNSGALTIAIVSKPFTFEGEQRTEVAEEGLANLTNKVDTLIIIPNDRLLVLCDHKTTVEKCFELADDAFVSGVKAISEVVTIPGLINLDFADIKAVLKDSGLAWLSVGKGSGQNRAAKAAKAALASPLLDISVAKAKSVIFNITGGSSLTLFECNEAAQVISQAVDPEANIIFGVVFDPKMDDEVEITLIVTEVISKLEVPVSTDEELRRLIKGSKEVGILLDIPSFFRSKPRIVAKIRQ
jgi:cell division protein FtsZ